MKTQPWFSTEKPEVRYLHIETVYHDNTSCSEGDGIEKDHHRHGTDNRPLCKQCARLNSVGR